MVDESLRERIAVLYINVSNIKDYLEINHSGFSKILKKFDKLTNASLKPDYMAKVDSEIKSLQELPFVTETMNDLEKQYAKLFCSGDREAAMVNLKQKLKDHVVYERNTVWRDMVEMERKAQPAAVNLLRLEYSMHELI